ncbi:hypothetical protein RV02_GL000781 [Enterococcus gilvus]|jgi:hypothetical protein|uniref:Uncharacterized protein n=1 Tax=Enterococcus gilvus ATCC BAA-350 TaxID=1158614 RepID=A0ABP2WVV0_9ENTE|nr:hypothetical protein I592_00957 [Enterococcus gilvus ATCC BAA-350]OJG41734.1 hypothetical protein RV02_GL000781 [Enterococcus gilvus]
MNYAMMRERKGNPVFTLFGKIAAGVIIGFSFEKLAKKQV